MLYPHARILIFAKAPEPGYAKTRLIPALGEAGAADLYRRLLRRTVERACAAVLCPVQLWCAPDADHPFFRRLASENPLALHPQTEGDLGARMHHAAGEALRQARTVLLIGTDCPLLGEAHLSRALQWLEQGEDAVLGPAEDGGYVLLGLSRNAPELFCDMPWGQGVLLEATRSRLEALGWRWRELETLWDLDRPADIGRWERVRGR